MTNPVTCCRFETIRMKLLRKSSATLMRIGKGLSLRPFLISTEFELHGRRDAGSLYQDIKVTLRDYELHENDRLLADSGEVASKGLLIDLLMSPDRAEEALVNLLGRHRYWVECTVAGKLGDFLYPSLGAIASFWTDWLLQRLKLLEIFRQSRP